ncbi:OLC1v1004084C1 [Oldenlandia corymbosa var. corymbosa]|uniref:OLC1v1004084C1 n=1 Tax=Oldenlandia corymbosa var. corymbosa TaxID=529605 RepID=A0AAV1DCQ2_OLDCO|nr:OLC1v1004084C1 [Oldenlandia corymbosa var. corymbosa]
MHRVTLVHHYRRRASAVTGGDSDRLPTPRPAGEPPGGKRHRTFIVMVVEAISFRRIPSVPMLVKVIQSEYRRRRVGGDRWRARVRGLVSPWHVKVPDGLQSSDVDDPEPEGVVLPAAQILVPTTGSSLHFPSMQVSSPSQSSEPVHEPPQEAAVARDGRKTIKMKRENNMKFDMVNI